MKNFIKNLGIVLVAGVVVSTLVSAQVVNPLENGTNNQQEYYEGGQLKGYVNHDASIVALYDSTNDAKSTITIEDGDFNFKKMDGTMQAGALLGPSLFYNSGPSNTLVTLVANASQDVDIFSIKNSSFVKIAGFDQNAILRQGGSSRVSSPFVKTADTTLASVTGLSANLQGGSSYTFKLILHANADATGGEKLDFGGGTATMSTFIDQVNVLANTSNSYVETSRQTMLTGATAGNVGDTQYYIEVQGTVTVNQGGTFQPRFAQKVANGASSVIVGSYMEVEQIN